MNTAFRNLRRLGVVLVITIAHLARAETKELSAEFRIPADDLNSAKLCVHNHTGKEITVFVNPNNLMGFKFKPEDAARIDPLNGERSPYKVEANSSIEIPVRLGSILKPGLLSRVLLFEAEIPVAKGKIKSPLEFWSVSGTLPIPSRQE